MNAVENSCPPSQTNLVALVLHEKARLYQPAFPTRLLLLFRQKLSCALHHTLHRLLLPIYLKRVLVWTIYIDPKTLYKILKLIFFPFLLYYFVMGEKVGHLFYDFLTRIRSQRFNRDVPICYALLP